MEKLDLRDIIRATAGKLICGNHESTVESISTDTRSIKAGDLFIALKGKNFDGNKFIKEAVKLGAKGVITSSADRCDGAFIVSVKDTTDALKKIALLYLQKMEGLKIVGITGSNGKTTTKDLAAHCLLSEYKVHKPRGSFNNQIGIPLTILELLPSHEVAVLEYGTGSKGEMKGLTAITGPDVAVITNIGKTHLEFFKTQAAIFEEKMNLVRAMRKNGTAVFNADDKYLSAAAPKYKSMTFGIKNKADVTASDIRVTDKGLNFRMTINSVSGNVFLPMLGEHNVYNALAAAAVCNLLEIKFDIIKEAFADFKLASDHRLSKYTVNGVSIIDDAYNANPDSVASAIRTLAATATGGKILVLGDMAELGTESEKLHYEMGMIAAANKIDMIITVGQLAKKIAEGAKKAGMNESNIFNFKENKEAVGHLKKILKAGDALLIKEAGK